MQDSDTESEDSTSLLHSSTAKSLMAISLNMTCCKKATGTCITPISPKLQSYNIVCFTNGAKARRPTWTGEKKNSDGANFLARSAQIAKGHMKSTLNSSMESYVGILLFFCFSSLFFLPSPEDTISIVYYTLQSCIKAMFITPYLHPNLFK